MRILKNISEVTETPIAEIEIAEDGCGALVHGIPLRNFAHGLAKIATGIGLEPRRADICKKIMRACILNPQMVAGTGKFCTLLMAASKGRIFAKSGAQGIYAVADMDSGISIISKTEDGNSEVNNAVVLEAIRQVGIADKELLKNLTSFTILKILIVIKLVLDIPSWCLSCKSKAKAS